uniref:Tr-type G domain-containing protein n=1 Tax=Aureoumbra lagunensis TaxID=44058 RepID=A0A7S3JW35_9STRA
MREDSTRTFSQVQMKTTRERRNVASVDELLDQAIDKAAIERTPPRRESRLIQNDNNFNVEKRRAIEEKLRIQRNALQSKKESSIIETKGDAIRSKKESLIDDERTRHKIGLNARRLSPNEEATLLGITKENEKPATEKPEKKRNQMTRRQTEDLLTNERTSKKKLESSLIIDTPLSKNDQLDKHLSKNDLPREDDTILNKSNTRRYKEPTKQMKVKSPLEKNPKISKNVQSGAAILRVSGSTVTIGRLASALKTSVEIVEAALLSLGEKAPEVKGHKKKAAANERRVDADVAELVALEMGRELRLIRIKSISTQEESESEKNLRALDKERNELIQEFRPQKPAADSDEWSQLELRPPVVAVMGHVDHGKTTLLDSFRGSHVAESEAGGITQRLSAFCVGKTTFIDTPGHAAFARMRSSSAAALDVALVVVAADDGVKQQTMEALDLARSRRAAVVFAMTKIDKFSSEKNLQEATNRIRDQLATAGFAIEADGGECPLVPVSAKTGAGLDELKATLEAQAEILDLRANRKDTAEATVVDGVFDKHLGLCADVIVAWGTLKVGDHVVVGECAGKIRRLEGIYDEVEDSTNKDTKKKKKRTNEKSTFK